MLLALDLRDRAGVRFRISNRLPGIRSFHVQEFVGQGRQRYTAITGGAQGANYHSPLSAPNSSRYSL